MKSAERRTESKKQRSARVSLLVGTPLLYYIDFISRSHNYPSVSTEYYGFTSNVHSPFDLYLTPDIIFLSLVVLLAPVREPDTFVEGAWDSSKNN